MSGKKEKGEKNQNEINENKKKVINLNSLASRNENAVCDEETRASKMAFAYQEISCIH